MDLFSSGKLYKAKGSVEKLSRSHGKPDVYKKQTTTRNIESYLD